MEVGGLRSRRAYPVRRDLHEDEAMRTRRTRRPRGSAIVAAIGLLVAVALGPATGSVVRAADPLAPSGQRTTTRDGAEGLRGGVPGLASDRLGGRGERTTLGAVITRGG